LHRSEAGKRSTRSDWSIQAPRPKNPKAAGAQEQAAFKKSSNGIDKAFFAKLLETFARQVGAERDRIILLQLDNAGWHTPENLPVPEGIRLVYQPAYTPELQPAEHLWPLIDEPLANAHFETIDDLDAALATRCC